MFRCKKIHNKIIVFFVKSIFPLNQLNFIKMYKINGTMIDLTSEPLTIFDELESEASWTVLIGESTSWKFENSKVSIFLKEKKITPIKF